MAPHQSRPLQERRPRVPGEVLYFLAAWKEKLATQELRYPTAAKNRQNARDQFAERDDLEDETLLQLLFGSAVEIVTAVGYLGKLIVTEVADAAVTISWWLFEKILSVLEWMCELRSRGGSFVAGKHPLSGNIFAFFVALMAGMLYCAFLEYSKIVYAHELLRQSINVGHFKLVFHVLLSMTVSAYLKGVVTGPGFVSDDKAQFRRWRTELHAMQVQRERKKKMYSRAEVQALNAEIAAAGAVSGDRLPGITEAGRLARVRFCQKELLFKPDRAHHCRVLGKNVLRMDHHCPWILNTVGLRNQKFFYLFLLYGTLAVDYLNAHLLHLLVTLLNGSGGASDWISLVGGSGGSFVSSASLWTALQGVPTSSLLVVTQGAVLSSLLAMAMNPFLVVHTYFMCKNMTTLEFFEQRGGGGSRSVAGSTSALKKSGKVNAKVEREGASGSPQESRPRAGGGSRGVVDDFLMTVREDEDGGEEALSDEATSDDPENNPYDLGIYENVAQVMGTKNFLLWPLPFVSSYAEDADLQKVGYTYPRNDDDQTAEDKKEDRPHVVGASSSAAGAQGTKKTANPSSHVARRKISEGAAARKGVVTQPPPRPLFYGEGVDPDVSVNLYQTHDPYQSGEEEDLSSQNMNRSSLLHTSNSSQHSRAGQSDQRSQYLLDSLGHGDSSRLAGSTSSQLSFLDLSKEEQRNTSQQFLFTRAAGEGGKRKKKKGKKCEGGEASSEESMGLTKLRSWVATAVDDVATGAEYFWEAVMAF